MKINYKTLGLADLQSTLLSTCNSLNRPIRKNQLLKMITDLFECNTQKEVEFALLDLVEQGRLCQKNHFICTPEFASTWDGTVTSADEGIIKFLLSLKEEAKNDLFFHVYAQEPLTPHNFFKYIEMKYPMLLHRADAALAFMEQMDKTLQYGLNNLFYSELNDYPVDDRWLTTFFNNPDCRIIIKSMDLHKNHVNMQIILIPSQKGNYKKANDNFYEFEENLPLYFTKDMVLHIRRSLITFSGSKRRKKQ